MDPAARWNELTRLVNDALEGALSQGSDKCPSELLAAMRHAVMGGGKRLRPVLCLEAAALSGGREQDALPAAVALEMVHAYSLVHDDLPCMDDADMRRGMPSVHRAFGEAMAVLAGDALLALAFEVLANKVVQERACWPEIMLELTRSAGSSGIVGGQVEDCASKVVSEGLIWRVHQRKTASLFKAALRMGALAAGAPSKILEALSEYGYETGLAYQLIDDLGDISDLEGVNAARFLGFEKTRDLALARIEAARHHIVRVEDRAHLLGWLLDTLADRARQASA